MGVITTEDGVDLVEGDRAFNYYDMQPGTIGRLDPYTQQGDQWFDFDHDDGTCAYLNGSRICTLEFAQRKGWHPR